MADHRELLNKHSEVREEILAIRNSIPTSRIFDRLGGISPKGSFRYWFKSFFLLNLILVLPSIIVAIELRGHDTINKVIIYGFAASEPVLLCFIIVHIITKNLLCDLANRIVPKIQDIGDLSKLVYWLKDTWSFGKILLFITLFCFVWTVLGLIAISGAVGGFVGFGFALWCLWDGFFAGLLIYYLFWACLLAFNLREYHYEMNSFMPADSEIIIEIVSVQTKSIYALAFATFIVSLAITSKVIDPKIKLAFSFPILVIAWTIITSQFFLTRSTLKSITNKAKWATLGRIRDRMNSLEIQGDLSDKDVAERLSRLIDVHKQVVASKTNTFDLKSGVTLVGQLMLPLLGILIGNLDKLMLFMKE